jgi:class 3 adenylate cyclase
MIVKIGALLAVGFGEAGSEIIAKNIENHGAVNAVLSGKKIVAIFGFCDIRNFTDATEVLQTKVMNFVNEIAAIVHGVVNRCAGSANKNIGDAFLLVWKFKEKETIISEIDGETSVSLRKISKVRQTADLAVYSFVKIIAEITKSSVLEKYKKNERLKMRIKNYEGVRMGFGLHVGWAIEGGIGSQFKIDASYLSPNVNMSSRLEAATKQFGANILISGELAELMTPKNKELLRKVDCVTVKGSNQPIDLFTIDLCIRNLAQNVVIKPRINKLTEMEKKRQKVMANTIRQNLLEKLETSKRITENLFSNDQDVAYLREPYNQDFYSIWTTGIEAYIKGDWKTALRSFKATHVIL